MKYTGEEGDVKEWSRQAFEYTDYNRNGFMSMNEAACSMLKHELGFREIDDFTEAIHDHANS